MSEATHQPRYVGVDMGTSTSSLAVCTREGVAELLAGPVPSAITIFKDATAQLGLPSDCLEDVVATLQSMKVRVYACTCVRVYVCTRVRAAHPWRITTPRGPGARPDPTRPDPTRPAQLMYGGMPVDKLADIAKRLGLWPAVFKYPHPTFHAVCARVLMAGGDELTILPHHATCLQFEALQKQVSAREAAAGGREATTPLVL